jgi:hypothetical protein
MTDDVAAVTASETATQQDRSLTCRAPNCRRDGAPVCIAGETEVPAVLCNTHAKTYLEGSR